LIASPMEIQVNGLPWTKFMVPSIGSMIQVGKFVNSGIWKKQLITKLTQVQG